jgi:DNA invertase Pin-like site-specific DNA recombinase
MPPTTTESHPSKPIRAALYARVSTDLQTTDNQLLELREYAARTGWAPTEYIDDAISGTKASRPALNRMMADAKAGRLDLVVVWRADRLGRSLINALLTIADLDARGIQIVSLREGFDNRTPSGRLQMQIVLAFAEYELESIRERIKAGISRARAQGTRLGRRPAIHPKSIGHDLIADLTLSGAEVARRLNISKSTVNGIRRQAKRRPEIPLAAVPLNPRIQPVR